MSTFGKLKYWTAHKQPPAIFSHNTISEETYPFYRRIILASSLAFSKIAIDSLRGAHVWHHWAVRKRTRHYISPAWVQCSGQKPMFWPEAVQYLQYQSPIESEHHEKVRKNSVNDTFPYQNNGEECTECEDVSARDNAGAGALNWSLDGTYHVQSPNRIIIGSWKLLGNNSSSAVEKYRRIASL